MLLTDFDRARKLERLAALGEEMSAIAREIAVPYKSQESEDQSYNRSSFPTGDCVSPDGEAYLVRNSEPPLPDPRLIRRIIRQRQLRARYFDGDLFGDPAWDMLLDLTAAAAEHTRVSVTSLCIASGVPPTTALRWIYQMIDAGLFRKTEDVADRRRAFISLTDRAIRLISSYFLEVGKQKVPNLPTLGLYC